MYGEDFKDSSVKDESTELWKICSGKLKFLQGNGLSGAMKL